MSFDLIPHVVLNPSNFVTYNEVNYTTPHSINRVHYVADEESGEIQSKFLNSKRKSEGQVSPHAERKIKKAIEYLVTTAQTKTVKEKVYGKTITFKTVFVTLTLPSKQIHSDKEIINKCLNPLLTELRSYYNVKNYIWRAELQKNGNIHFHLIIDKFVAWNELRNRWNRIVNRLDYVERFYTNHGHKTPNSTDIHSTRKVRDIKAYLVKYLAKDDQTPEKQREKGIEQRSQEGRIWGCNQELSNCRGLNMVIDSEISDELKKVVANAKVEKYEGTYFTVWHCDYHTLLKAGSEILFKYFSDYLFEHFKFSEQLNIQL